MRADISMAAVFWVMGVSLLIQCCLCSVGQTDRGCMKWTPKGDNVCCKACHPGHHLVKTCGPSPKDLCTPCEAKTFTVDPLNFRCYSCSQCLGVQVYVKECTATTDTQCGCKEGFTCGDAKCSFCVKTCDKGQEPTNNRFCRPCPEGTFNDQIHQMCKPWSTKCPNPDQKIVAKGDALTDIRCENVSLSTVSRPKKPDPTEEAWPLSVVTTVVLSVFSILIVIIFISILAQKIYQKRKKNEKKTVTKTPIIRTPTDDPRTLIAMECSFHEAQQEQGSSSESLASGNSSDQLIA